MTYLYVLIGVLAFMAARNVLAVRRLTKQYAQAIAREQNDNTIQPTNP